MGVLRRPNPSLQRTHSPLSTGHKLLGRRDIRPDVLDHVVPFGRCETAAHDGSNGGWSWGWDEEVPVVDGRGESRASRERMEGVLERLRALLLAGVSGECYGVGCI